MKETLFDYINWRGDLSFEQSPFNTVDALIFACLSYLHFPIKESDEKTIKEIELIWKDLPESEKFCGIGPMKNGSLSLISEAAKTRRYGKVAVSEYVQINSEEDEEQFSAMTFLLPGRVACIAFRGTDGSLVGWKEDFNMAFTAGTPSQIEAQRYIDKIAKKYRRYRLEICGQSKGGNLAVWGACFSGKRFKRRINHVYNLDGPGFCDSVYESEEYKLIENKILSFVPESSVVGVLMGNGDYLTIKSSTISLMQHNPYTWYVMGNHFVYGEKRTASGKIADKKVNEFIQSMSKEQREEFVEAIFDDFEENNAKSLSDLFKHPVKHISNVVLQVAKIKNKNKDKNNTMLDDLQNMIKTLRE